MQAVVHISGILAASTAAYFLYEIRHWLERFLPFAFIAQVASKSNRGRGSEEEAHVGGMDTRHTPMPCEDGVAGIYDTRAGKENFLERVPKTRKPKSKGIEGDEKLNEESRGCRGCRGNRHTDTEAQATPSPKTHLSLHTGTYGPWFQYHTLSLFPVPFSAESGTEC